LPVPPDLLLDDSDDRIVRELWWGNQEFSPVDIIPLWFSMLIYRRGMINRPVGGRISETYSHPIEMVTIIFITIKVS
jgi:hypothetical protein